MNRFRASLHPAFFTSPETPPTQENSETPPTQENSETPSFDIEFEIIKEIADDTMLNNYLNVEKLSNEWSANLGNDNYDRFIGRCETKNAEGRPYKYLWAKGIAEGFGSLITKLKESHYFDKENYEDMEKIENLYLTEVNKQYKENVWDASDEEFNKEKNYLFDKKFQNSMVDKVYSQLINEE